MTRKLPILCLAFMAGCGSSPSNEEAPQGLGFELDQALLPQGYPVLGHASYADVDGDGKSDLIYQTYDNRFLVARSLGTSFAPPVLGTQHGGLFEKGRAQYADVNADGRSDLIVQGSCSAADAGAGINNCFYVSLGQTAGTLSTPILWGKHGGNFTLGQAQYADVTGDGRADLIFQGTNNQFWLSISTGSSFGNPSVAATHSGSFVAGQAQYADINGDRRTDLVVQTASNAWYVSLSTGNGFGAASLAMQHGGTFAVGQAQYADVTGDGRSDLIFQGSCSAAQQAAGINNCFYVSPAATSGTSFGTPTVWVTHGGSFALGQAQYADVSGDGRADLIFQSTDNRFWLSNSTGTSFSAPQATIQHAGTFVPGQAQYVDVSGDGRKDLVFQGLDNAEWISSSLGTTLQSPSLWLQIPELGISRYSTRRYYVNNALRWIVALDTFQASTCRWDTNPAATYGEMRGTMGGAGTMTHAALIGVSIAQCETPAGIRSPIVQIPRP